MDVKVIICSCLDTRDLVPLKTRISWVCKGKLCVWDSRDWGTRMRLPFFCDICCSWTQRLVIPLPSVSHSPRLTIMWTLLLLWPVERPPGAVVGSHQLKKGLREVRRWIGTVFHSVTWSYLFPFLSSKALWRLIATDLLHFSLKVTWGNLPSCNKTCCRTEMCYTGNIALTWGENWWGRRRTVH